MQSEKIADFVARATYGSRIPPGSISKFASLMQLDRAIGALGRVTMQAIFDQVQGFGGERLLFSHWRRKDLAGSWVFYDSALVRYLAKNGTCYPRDNLDGSGYLRVRGPHG